MKLSQKMMLFTVIAICVMSIIICGAAAILFRNNIIRECQSRLRENVTTAVKLLDTKAVAELSGLTEANDFQGQLTDEFTDIIASSDLVFLYLVSISDGEVLYLVDGSSEYYDEPTAFLESDIVDNFGEEILTAAGGEAINGEPYDSEYGRLMSYYAPITYNGEVVAVLGGDMSIDYISGTIGGLLLVLFSVTAGIILVFCILFFIFIRRQITTPLRTARDAADKLASGSLDTGTSASSRKDEIGELLRSFNSMSLFLRDIISDMTRILGNISDGNLDEVSPETEYSGDFAPIAESLDTISSSLVNIMTRISEVSAEVSGYAKSCGDASEKIAVGSQEQSAVLNEISGRVDGIKKLLCDTGANLDANRASVSEAESIMQTSDQNVSDMSAAMNNIESSTNEIRKIIKSIDDIAFQTNILALNAAVEAARAGEQGKGFAVVADEVGNLAKKCSTAVNETKKIVAEVIDAVKSGVITAGETAGNIHAMSEKFGAVSQTTEAIADSAAALNDSFDSLGESLGKLSGVAESNIEISGETDEYSKKLGEGSDELYSLVEAYRK